MKEFSFIYMTDNGFIMPTIVSICSLVNHKSMQANYSIYVFQDQVSDEGKECLNSLRFEGVEIHSLRADCTAFDDTAKAGKWDKMYVSRTDMFKFELPQCLQYVDKALYIDGDTIVNKCAEEIFDIDIDSYYLAAADDMGDSHDANGYSSSFKRIGIDEKHYFNAGIMYLNLKKMREDNVSEKIWDYRINGINYFMSQDALNFVLRHDRVNMPYEFNFLTCALDYYSFEDINELFCFKKYKDIEECISDQTILHMAGELKPWKYNMPWITDVFKKYYDISPYRDKELLLRSPLKQVIDNNIAKEYSNLWKAFELNVTKGEKLVLYGAGAIGKNIYKFNKDKEYCDILLWVDKNAERIGNIDGAIIELPHKIKTIEKQLYRIVIANSSPQVANEIRTELKALDIDVTNCVTIG